MQTRIDLARQSKGSGGGGGSDLNPASSHHVISISGNNAAVIKNFAGTVYGWTLFNAAGYKIYVKLYDKATTPNPASDTPKRTIGIQAGMPAPPLDYDGGLTFSSGIAMAIVQGSADSDNTAVAAGDCIGDINFI